MSKSVLWKLGIVLAAGVLYLIGYQSVQPVGTESGQIRGAIVDAVGALQNGRAGDAMRAVAPDYKDSTGGNATRLRLLARQAARNRDQWTATVVSVDPVVTGDTATAAVTVAIEDSQGGRTGTETIQLRLRKDPVHAWLIFPTERWRVTGADHLPGDAMLLGG